jgi:polyisoprenoid-binding protein YceI
MKRCMEMRAIRYYLISCCLCWISGAGSIHAAEGAGPGDIVFSIHPDSYVSYKAPVRIALVAGSTVEGVNHEITGEIVWRSSESRNEISATLVIDAGAFDSGNSRRDRDVRNILNAEKYPDIVFTLTALLGVENGPPETIGGEYVAIGKLTVNDTDKEVSVPVKIRHESESLRIEGSVAVRYTDFNIDPPRVGAFISRAPDELRLHVHIIAEKTHGRQDQGNH